MGGWGWPNANVSTKAFFGFEEKKVIVNFFGFFSNLFYAVPFSENFFLCIYLKRKVGINIVG